MVTSVEAMFNEQWNCSKCVVRFKDPEALERQFKIKSCKDSGSFRFQIGNIRYNKCPGNFVTPQVSYLLSLFTDYEQHGGFPESGSLLDQCYKTWEIVSIIENTVVENRKRLQDRENKKSKGRRV